MEPGIFSCSICGETSQQICLYCTKDTCGNHRCDRCGRCSDCCECEVPRNAVVTNGNGAHQEVSVVNLFLDPGEQAL